MFPFRASAQEGGLVHRRSTAARPQELIGGYSRVQPSNSAFTIHVNVVATAFAIFYFAQRCVISYALRASLAAQAHPNCELVSGGVYHLNLLPKLALPSLRLP